MNMIVMEADATSAANLRQALKDALDLSEREGDETRVSTLRLVLCALRDRDMRARSKDECKGCDDAEIIDILRGMIEQRDTAIAKYEAAGRIELADKEREEREVLAGFLPQALPVDAVDQAARDVVQELDASGLKDMGRCVSELKARFPDQIETATAKKAVKAYLL